MPILDRGCGREGKGANGGFGILDDQGAFEC